MEICWKNKYRAMCWVQTVYDVVCAQLHNDLISRPVFSTVTNDPQQQLHGRDGFNSGSKRR
jgi:hypothetical protein